MLDMNLEKSRVKETESEISKQHQRLESRLETEVANLKTTFEQHKADSIKYLAGNILNILKILIIEIILFFKVHYYHVWQLFLVSLEY